MENFAALHVAMIAIFVLGYALIAFEHTINVNKSAVALIVAVSCWSLLFLSSSSNHEQLTATLSNFISADAQIILFLIAALTIVEIIHLHKGFSIITDLITMRSKRRFMWVIGIIAFMLSAIIDNLTTTVVIISMVAKLVPDRNDRLLIGAAAVVAANAGGAFSPIGDVTTTMLWIDGKITAWPIMRGLFLPSFACFAISTFILMFGLKGEFASRDESHKEPIEPRGLLVLLAGALAMISVPIFKFHTGLPPMMGVLLGLGILWLVTDLLHHPYDSRKHLMMPSALSRIDTSSVLFFLGILLSVNALEETELLHALANWMQVTFTSPSTIAALLGFFSAIIDNVPLVAASMGMYDLSQYPADAPFWQLIAYCAGTGGSLLIIGSAAGVVYMGLERVSFFWYLRRVGPAALAGYLGGIGIYLMVG